MESFNRFLALKGLMSIVSGGGDSTGGGMVAKGGIFTATATRNTVEHGLGVMPDFVMVYTREAGTSNNLVVVTGLSNKLYSVVGGSTAGFAALYGGGH